VKITIDLKKCEAEGRCFGIYPDLFDEGKDGKGVVNLKAVADDDGSLVMDADAASNLCPHTAITVEYD
jgi:ferredoxin